MEDRREMILAALRATIPPGQVTELRILGVGGKRKRKVAGWFDDMDALADAVIRFERQSPAGTYFIPNKLHAGCLARAVNKTIDWPEPGQLSSDNDIVRRHFLLIDLDPDRPKEISSRDSELEAARVVGREITKWLADAFEFPSGVHALSGNGVHLLYRIDLPNDDDSKALLRDCLISLGRRFNKPVNGVNVKIDRTVFNAARIWKLYGTAARKGSHTTDRPHRYATLVRVNGKLPVFDELGIVTPEQLQQLADFGRPPSTQPKSKSKSKKKKVVVPTPDSSGYYFDLDSFIGEHNIQVSAVDPWDGGLRYILKHCLFDESHSGSEACIGRASDGAIFYKCQHDSCSGRTWKDVREKFDPAAKRAVERREAEEAPTDPYALARMILDDIWTDDDTGELLARRHRQQFYVYSHERRCYVTVDQDTLQADVTRWLGDRVEKTTVRLVRDTMNALAAIVNVDPEPELPFMCLVKPDSGAPPVAERARRNRIALRNGILDIDEIVANKPFEDCLRPHSANWLSTVALDFDFPVTQEQTRCDRWRQFLHETFEGDDERVAVLQELMGYCLTPTTRHEKFAIFIGGGQNGKSTVLNVITHMLTEKCTSSISPAQFTNATMLYLTYGKLANLCFDMRKMDSVEEGLIKAMVSGDLVTADRKYLPAVQFRPTATLIFATNLLPTFIDTTDGIWRRVIILPFDHKVPMSKRDGLLFEEKLVPEMPGILLWALEGLARLEFQKGFSDSRQCNLTLHAHKRKCFPILAFLDECTETGGEVVGKKLYDTYREWCRDCGLTKPKPLQPFLSDVLTFRPDADLAESGRGQGPGRNDTIKRISLTLGLQFGHPQSHHPGEYDMYK